MVPTTPNLLLKVICRVCEGVRMSIVYFVSQIRQTLTVSAGVRIMRLNDSLALSTEALLYSPPQCFLRHSNIRSPLFVFNVILTIGSDYHIIILLNQFLLNVIYKLSGLLGTPPIHENG